MLFSCHPPRSNSATPPASDKKRFPLPFEGDRILGLVLSKALLLVSDTKITDPTIARQLS